MTISIQPHGADKLVDLVCTEAEHKSLINHTDALPRIDLSSREAGDLIMIGTGGFTPLTGFMDKENWRSVCDSMRMVDGTLWPIPITLSVDEKKAEEITEGQKVALYSRDAAQVIGIMSVTEKYTIDKTFECQSVFKTTDINHPGVAQVMQQPAVNLAGPITLLSQAPFNSDYPGLYMTAQETRLLFEQKGWQRIVAFQTRNPMHRSHEFLVKIALQLGDGVLIHSLLGQLKPGDIPAKVRTHAIAILVENYFIDDTVVQAGYPLDMRYAGPREAVLHAIFRQNYGCTDLIIGRDHAGVGNYYGPFDAQAIFNEIPNDALKIKPLLLDWTFWCYRCQEMTTAKTCPHNDDRLMISGTRLREMMEKGEEVPEEFSRPEVVKILKEYYTN